MLVEKFAEALGYAREIKKREERILELQGSDPKKEATDRKLKTYNTKGLICISAVTFSVAIISGLITLLMNRSEEPMGDFIGGMFTIPPVALISLLVFVIIRRIILSGEKSEITQKMNWS